jgi:hypothetical protein
MIAIQSLLLAAVEKYNKNCEMCHTGGHSPIIIILR